MNKSQIFTIYNKARSNKALQKLDKCRVNRALGYLLSQDQSWRAKYNPTVTACKCLDHYHGHTCKHIIACMIETRWERDNSKEKEQVLPAPPKLPVDTNVYMPNSNGSITVAVQKKGTYDLHIFPDADEFKRYMKKFGFDGMAVRPSKVKGSRGHTVPHGWDEWME